ncbi:hypothetical protein H8S90_08775 [Olivibacter sp. SDN3]|uniref:hypothetical protein n=1 Tax=Olivibacter sp. SDN3 TaxID=2764720 RepID=UPI0016516F3B|nr:hypothetical protein [Olivibacter sp. SDN3]QNL51647.1 hypothetical protein H8S90_08775 [Olivibacter sp. SDN3]
MKYLFTLSVLLLLNISVLAQDRPSDSFNMAIAITDADAEDYLAPLKMLKNIPIAQEDQAGLSMWLQAMTTYYSFLGDYDSTLYYSDQRYLSIIDSLKVECDTAFVKTHEFIDAADYIISQSAKHQITMMNEAHHIPYHRAFVTEMLRGFYNAGYRYLAVETLEDSMINSSGEFSYKTGYYSREPLFGELMRHGLHLGFQLVPYESKQPCDNKGADRNYCNSFRDSVMAVNLGKIIAKDPQAKILVYAGYDHIHKGNANGWKKMGQYIKQITGIEPFAIDQTKEIEHFYPQLETKEFTAVNNLRQISRPVIAMNDGKAWHGEFVDVSIIFPRYRGEARPGFYQIAGLRKPYKVKFEQLTQGQTVQAFYANEAPGWRIPADQYLVSDKDNVLYLFPGRYHIEIKNSDGEILVKEEVIVKGL